MNAVEIEEAISSLAEQPFVRAEFPFSFLAAFGNKETTIKRLRTGNNNKSDIVGGVLQQNNIHIAVCDEGRVNETLLLLKQSPSTVKGKVKFILATDGKDFQAEDVFSGETVSCEYSTFHNYFGFFLPLAGISTVKQIRENAFDIKATSRLNKLYIELLRHNPEWASPERRHDMNHFLARLIFCFFAEDTDIFQGNGLFTDTVQKISASDASNTHEVISEIFRSMDVKQQDRIEKKIKNWAMPFPYVNGQLFSGSTETPKFTKIARSYLLHVGNLDWKKINPDIFGSMIQAVADIDERGELGMHYTSVPNILKVLNPLFLDDLREQLADAGDNSRKLLNLRKRISRIRIFDPACGSGNFLVIAYKQLREIEYEINLRRNENNQPTEIPLTNFRGVELRDFSAEVARLALIIAEYQCDLLYRGQQLALAEFLPLNAENWIICGNSLRLDWFGLLDVKGKGVQLFGDDLFNTPKDQSEIEFENEGGEYYICGNPPYLGSKRQNDLHKDDLKNVFEKYTDDWKPLDYVAAWLIKAAEFGSVSNTATALVTTNSICQGQQVAILWPLIFRTGHEISFAHTSFKWANLATHNAGVTVVIVGIKKNVKGKRKIFETDENGKSIVRQVENINPYLVSGENIVVKNSKDQISKLPEFSRGNSPTDGGHLLLDSYEVEYLGLTEEQKEKFIRPFVGSLELIRGIQRFCIWIEDENIQEALNIPSIYSRIQKVKAFRLESSKKATINAANWPHRFDERKPLPESPIICVPVTSSENREYLPVGLLKSQTAISNSSFGMPCEELWVLALIASKMNLIWVATVCSRMRTDYRFTNTMGWNTFPVPLLTEKNKSDLTRCAEDILIARERHFPATIADLYDSEEMPEDLRRAHERNDEVIERIYIGRQFRNDTERLQKLFDLYTNITSKPKAL
ncbi:class I SAM-dependent DNA methyltransferase [Mucilaginibacter defluvii]|uniref:site-specific DNA-methyltransferase (adenine-specific) n=1 Tax=Mucilaginibacter defluvii TaxID=1196019 RepID=A0ABP9FL54_9SPHI